MTWRNNSERYGSAPITLHWLMLLLLISVYACIELRVLFPKGSDPREALKMWHFMLGLSVLVLASLRLLVRFVAGPAPLIDPPPPKWQQMIAKVMHLAMYALMLGMPLAGWLILSSSGKSIPFFGLELPPLVEENKVFSEWMKEIHETAGTVGYFLIGLHAAAALFHHYLFRDNTLLRILPSRKRLRS